MPSNSWAAGWIAGDVPTAAEFSKGVGAIYNTTLGAGAATIDITGIVNTYAHLLLIVQAKSDTAALSTTLSARFNGDTSLTYHSQRIRGSAAVTSASENLAANLAVVGQIGAATASPAIGVASLLIPNYADGTVTKAWLGESFSATNNTTGTLYRDTSGGYWAASTAAINRITLLPAAGNFAAGARVTLYAMGS